MPFSFESRRMPAEWEQQSGILLTWPHRHSDWKTELDGIDSVYVNIVQAIITLEPVLIICYDETHQDHIYQLLASHNLNRTHIYTVIIPSNDTWARDYAPLTIIENQQFVLLDFVFNGWGDKYEAHLDNTINIHLKNAGVFSEVSLSAEKFVLEGGSIESDGAGTLLTTKSCLLKSNRNPDLSQKDIEQALRNKLGANRILWLEHGFLAGDDTDGHIDNLARFCNPHTIIYIKCENKDDEHYDELNKMEQDLRAFIREDGTPYTLIPLPLPDPVYSTYGHRMPASYANFLIINNAVLMPVYGDSKNDKIALKVLEQCFSDRTIIKIDCTTLIQQNGGIHCASMHFPDGILACM